MVNEAKIIYNAKVQPLWLNGLTPIGCEAITAANCAKVQLNQ